VFVFGKPFRSGIIFASKARVYLSKFRDRLLALVTNIRTNSENVSGTKTPAYFVSWLEEEKKVLKN
jgi:hypothetical protein